MGVTRWALLRLGTPFYEVTSENSDTAVRERRGSAYIAQFRHVRGKSGFSLVRKALHRRFGTASTGKMPENERARRETRRARKTVLVS